jgi:hypothetical protein
MVFYIQITQKQISRFSRRAIHELHGATKHRKKWMHIYNISVRNIVSGNDHMFYPHEIF